MKNKLMLFALLLFALRLTAQDFEIVGVESLPTDMSARVEVKTDRSNHQCALLRVATRNITPAQREGFVFTTDLGSEVVERATREGEIWLWVSPGVKYMRIKHRDWGQYELRFQDYVAQVEALHTYKIIIRCTLPSQGNVVMEQQYLTFHISPANATLEVEGEIWPVSWEGTARRRVDEGSYSYRVQALNYKMQEGTVAVEDSARVVTINLEAIEAQQEHKEWSKETFVTLNGAYSTQPQLSFGFSVGQVKHFGWFVSAMTNGGFKSMGSLTQINEQGYVEDGHKPILDGTKTTDRLSVIAGGVMRITGPLFARLGVGYGVRNLCWQGVDGQWYKVKGYSIQGLDASAGVQAHFGGFVVSLEAVTTNFQTLEGKVGVGYAF